MKTASAIAAGNAKSSFDIAMNVSTIAGSPATAITAQRQT
jgi:hypothetical protein